jgi:hypothetical protein
MGTTTLYRDADTFPDGTRYEMVATSVPADEDFPEGVKYRFQYMDADGRTLLRFDNFPHHPGVDRHYYHTPEGVRDDVEYTGLADHVRAFHDAVDARRQR